MLYLRVEWWAKNIHSIIDFFFYSFKNYSLPRPTNNKKPRINKYTFCFHIKILFLESKEIIRKGNKLYSKVVEQKID